MFTNGMCDYHLVLLDFSPRREGSLPQRVGNQREFGTGVHKRLLPGPMHLSLPSRQPARDESDLEAKLGGAWFTYEAERELPFSLHKKLEFLKTHSWVVD